MYFFPKIDCKDRKLHCSMGVLEEDRASRSNRLFFRDCIDRELWKCLETGKTVVLTKGCNFEFS